MPQGLRSQVCLCGDPCLISARPCGPHGGPRGAPRAREQHTTYSPHWAPSPPPPHGHGGDQKGLVSQISPSGVPNLHGRKRNIGVECKHFVCKMLLSYLRGLLEPSSIPPNLLPCPLEDEELDVRGICLQKLFFTQRFER